MSLGSPHPSPRLSVPTQSSSWITTIQEPQAGLWGSLSLPGQVSLGGVHSTEVLGSSV
jgi:hypothetical protein